MKLLKKIRNNRCLNNNKSKQINKSKRNQINIGYNRRKRKKNRD